MARLLLGRGAEVRCLLRWQTDGSALQALGAEIVRGDLTSPDSLAVACAGSETVVTTASAVIRRLTGASTSTVRAIDGDGMGALITAAEAAGVGRFVYTSAAAVSAGADSPLRRAKLANEARLAASTMRGVVVRPDSFQEVHLGPIGRFDMARGRATIIGRGDNPIRFVAIDDVAALVAAVALEPDPPGIVEFGGPDPLSKNEAVEIAEELTGRRMKVQRMPRAAARLARRLLARPNDALATVFGNGLTQDTVPVTWDDAPLRERGIVPRPATEFLREQARGLTRLAAA